MNMQTGFSMSCSAHLSVSGRPLYLHRRARAAGDAVLNTPGWWVRSGVRQRRFTAKPPPAPPPRARFPLSSCICELREGQGQPERHISEHCPGFCSRRLGCRRRGGGQNLLPCPASEVVDAAIIHEPPGTICPPWRGATASEWLPDSVPIVAPQGTPVKWHRRGHRSQHTAGDLPRWQSDVSSSVHCVHCPPRCHARAGDL